MKYLLDTDHISILQLRSGQEYRELALRAGRQAEDLSVSIISFHEQVLGGHTYLSRARNMGEVMKGYKLLEQIIQGFSAALVLPFDEKAAEHFENLRASRIRIATMDLRIAAIALSRELVLLTRNRRDFIQVPGLVIEDLDDVMCGSTKAGNRPFTEHRAHPRSCPGFTSSHPTLTMPASPGVQRARREQMVYGIMRERAHSLN